MVKSPYAGKAAALAAKKKIISPYAGKAATLAEKKKMENVNNSLNDWTGIFTPVNDFQMSAEEEKLIRDSEAASLEPYFTRENQYADTQFNKQSSDYSRLIWYAQSDAAKTLAQNNRTFARSMSNAFNAYGKRGLLGSGILNQQAKEYTDEYNRTQSNVNEWLNRAVTWYERNQEDLKTAYDRLKSNLQENQTYMTELNVNSAIQDRKNDYYYNKSVEDETSISSYLAWMKKNNSYNLS